MYFENGQLCAKYACKNDRFEGPWEEYYENGQLYRKFAYKDGKFEGPFVEYYSDGRVRESGYYKKGKQFINDEPTDAASIARSKLNRKLKQLAKQMKDVPELCKDVQRKAAAEFREEYPQKSAGRAPRKKRGGNEGR